MIHKLTESDLLRIVTRVINEQEDDKPFEKGKFGVRGARSRSPKDFQATPGEEEIKSRMFGKYGEDVPPIVLRYLRKIDNKTLTQRLIDLNKIDLETVLDNFDVEEK